MGPPVTPASQERSRACRAKPTCRRWGFVMLSPSYLDPGSGGPGNDFTNRNTTFMTGT